MIFNENMFSRCLVYAFILNHMLLCYKCHMYKNIVTILNEVKQYMNAQTLHVIEFHRGKLCFYSDIIIAQPPF